MESHGGKRVSAFKLKDKTMKASKPRPMGFLALALKGTGAVVATAQTTPIAPDTPAAHGQVERAGYRGNRAAVGRGGSEIFRALFTEVDVDGDGSVTQGEIYAYRATKVGEADVSRDGALSIAEFDTLYREFTRPRMVDAVQKLDADGDGAISAGEVDARFGGVVDRMDGDGALTLQDRRRHG